MSGVTAEALEPLRIAVHVAAAADGATSGTFLATGLFGDSGAVPVLERFAGLTARLRLPLVVHGAESLAGAAGTIAIAYDGVFRPAGPGVFSGEGAWRVTGGDHAYERLDGSGTWAATAVFGAKGLTVDTILEGIATLA